MRRGWVLYAALAACGDNQIVPADVIVPIDSAIDAACDDPRYVNGTCQIDLLCGVPDLDCFVTFANDLDAGSWATTRIGTAFLSRDDPRFIRARQLTDRAWQMFQADVPVGGLAKFRVGLAVMDDPSINAYTMADGAPGKVGMSIQINRGLIESTLTDDEVIGVILHELTHVVRLHALTDVAYAVRKFYLAYDGEPVGAVQPEYKVARAAGSAWRTQAVMTGILADPAYGELPIDGNLGNLFGQFTSSVQSRLPTCIDVVNRMTNFRSRLAFSRLDGSLPFAPARQDEASALMTELETCVAADPFTLRQLAETLGPAWAQYLQLELSTAEKALLDGRALDSILAIVHRRRATLHRIEIAFTARTTAPWAALRYYSIEDEADDYSIHIGTTHQLSAIGVGATMFAVLGDQRPACEALLATGTVPYGLDLLDEHHAACWRIDHARRITALLHAGAPAASLRPAPGISGTPTEREIPHPIY